ncbi:cellulase family glycosylhydrolase [Microbacterium pseudoresistens]|uniref:Endoglycosylceramidase n=1 Tax=Microbacterium pseudoresistens TaxID=640634 RepID=A0A7Y9EUN9_9MICO|nr:endoglycosylceramidase [Microbacterium pseudoresistens]
MANPGRVVFGLLLTAAVIGGGVAAAMRETPEATEAFLADDAGRAIVAHGFSTAGSAKSSPDGLPVFTEDDLQREYSDMGTNFVRFLISWRAVEPEEGVIDQSYLDAVAERVAWYSARGYHVMLDMHQDLWGQAITPSGENGNGAPAWATHLDGLPVTPQDQWELIYLEPGVIRAFDHFWNTTGEHPELREHYAQAWRAVAERFADDPAVVAYDLMNEPYGGTLQGVAFESGPLTDLYQRTADAIREVDDDTWLCLEPQAFGFNWGLPSALGAVDDARDGDARVAFCPHLYPLSMDLGDGYDGSSRMLVDGTVAAWTRNVLNTADMLGKGEGPVPVILGEFGLDTTAPGAQEYVELVYRTADEHGFGVAYWSRDDGDWGPYDGAGGARNLVSWLDRPYPRAVDGLVSWRSGADELQVTVRGAEGAAELYLPPDRFADPVVTGGTVQSWDAATGILVVRPVTADATLRITSG